MRYATALMSGGESELRTIVDACVLTAFIVSSEGAATNARNGCSANVSQNHKAFGICWDYCMKREIHVRFQARQCFFFVLF